MTRCPTAHASPWRALFVLILLLGLSPAARLVQAAGVETLNADLANPWSIAFLPGGGFLVTERGGRLLRLSPDGELDAEISGVPPALVAGQGGLMDVVLDPAFERNGWVYLSHAVGRPDANALHVTRARLNGDALVEHETILEIEPSKSTPQHYGARMAFLPDGTLLVTSGEGWDHREDAQRTDGLLGKIVRIRSDGSIPEDNPFVDDPAARDEIYSYGHRNPQGLVVAPDGTIWEHEHGPAGGDEVNRIRPGLNYGWPVATHGMDYVGARISPFESYPGMEEPDLFWTPSIAPSGMAWLTGTVFPEWRGDLLVGGLAIRGLHRVDVVDGRATTSERVLPEIDARIRDVRTGPDGRIYVLTDADPGRLLRIDRSP